MDTLLQQNLLFLSRAALARIVSAARRGCAATPPPRYASRRVERMASVDSNDLFPVRTINFLGRDVPTLGQNEFGPCALLGVVNALLLRGTLKVSSDHGALTLQDVLARLADRLIEANQAAQDNPDVRAALDGAVTRLPTLAEGLDVNVKFAGGLFEFTSDLAIFDLLDVRLVHGWRVDGENDPEAAEALGSRSYNECIQEVVQLRTNELEVRGPEQNMSFNCPWSRRRRRRGRQRV